MYPQDAGRRQRKRVLVVDDEPMVTDWLKMVIEQAERTPPYEVRSAAVGSRAVPGPGSHRWGKPAVSLA